MLEKCSGPSLGLLFFSLSLLLAYVVHPEPTGVYQAQYFIPLLLCGDQRMKSCCSPGDAVYIYVFIQCS